MRNYVIVFLIVIIISCKDSASGDTEALILNDCLPQIIDTSVLKDQAQQMESRKEDANSKTISVYDSLIGFAHWPYMHKEIYDSLKNVRSELFEKSLIFNVEKLKQLGSYKLKVVNDSLLKNFSGYIAHVNFSRVAFNEQKAYFLFTLQQSKKIGFTKLVGCRKENDKWIVYKQEDVQRW
ncbi:MAG: hypothetical protein JWN76_3584 [Chitinophagaceae bacterium]|nr:hypothetical protein [Chitinophagaceae bacterium]